MLWAAFTLPVALSLLLSSSAKLQLTSDTAETPLESRLDNPNYFEGDLDISQAIIDALYEQQSGKDVSILFAIQSLQLIHFAHDMHH